MSLKGTGKALGLFELAEIGGLLSNLMAWILWWSTTKITIEVNGKCKCIIPHILGK